MTAASNRYRYIMDEENLKAAFNIIDIDGSGKITLEQLKECFQMAILSNTEECKEQEGGEWETIMKEIDTNQDGFIDFEDFR